MTSERSFGRTAHQLPSRCSHSTYPTPSPATTCPKHNTLLCVELQIVHWMHWVSEARVAARATAGRPPPPPRTNRSLPGGGRFMKWGRWEGRWSVEEEAMPARGASSTPHSSLLPPPPVTVAELQRSSLSGGGALHIGMLLTYPTPLVHCVLRFITDAHFNQLTIEKNKEQSSF